MTIVFDRSVPEGERRWMRALIRRCATVYGFETWEFRVACRRFRGKQLAECTVKAMASIAEITIHPARLADRALARADLLHEMWHLLDDELLATLSDLAAHIQNPLRRARAYRRAYRRYEAWHDRTARIVGGLL